MRLFQGKFPRLFLAAVLLGLATPALTTPERAGAEVALGGYTAAAEAAVVRIGIYEPALPIPAEPQLDVSLGYARSSTSTGPVARALASYLWPGDTLGDGLGTLFGDDALDYPVKVNSKYPASDAAPAQNAVQITDGNGMVTSADGVVTKATVTGAQVGGNLVSGIGTGLCSLLKQTCPEEEIGVPLPLPIATAASLDVAKSQSTVDLGKAVVSTARTHATGLSILGGLISIDGFDMTARASSDGTTAKTDGSLTITGLTIAGKKVALEESVNLDDPDAAAPASPLDFSGIGIKVDYLNRTQQVDGASGKLAAEGLTITVDAAVLGKALNLGMLSDLLAPVIGDIPQLGPLLTGLLKFGTKIVITVGDVRVSSNATPAYVPPPVPPGEDPEDPGSVTVPPSNGVPPGIGVLDPGTPTTTPGVTPDLTGLAPSAGPFQFPGLGQTPSLLLLAALALAGLVGWLFKGFGTFFLAADDCDLGAAVGVPNLREG